MTGLEVLAVALIASAIALPAGVAFGIRIGTLREQDRRARQMALWRRQAALYGKPHGTHRNTRHLLDWSNGKGSQEDL